MSRSERDSQIAKAKALLQEHGFALSIQACGCCNSPWVRLAHNGEDVIFEVNGSDQRDARDSACFDMFSGDA